MDFNAIQNLMKEMKQSDLILLDIESEGVHIKMQKNNVECQMATEKTIPPKIVSLSTQIPTQTQIKEVQNIETVNVIHENCKEILSPIVGTFYSSMGPDKPLLVNIGDKVKKGQILCIIEAMKLMNEIESDYTGEIIEILVKNEQAVEYGQPLFKICEN